MSSRTPWCRPSCLLVLMTALGASAAQADDAPRSADCQRALDALQSQEALSAPAPGASMSSQARARLEPLRREASRACLGAAPGPQAPRATLRAPISVAPVAPAPVARPTSPAPASPPVQVRSPAVVTSCDATGCWASDGSRLQRLGPDLVGPRGTCTVQGAVLNCPPPR